MSLWGTLGTAVGTAFGGPAGGALGGTLGSYADSKVDGVPSPQSGSEQGNQYMGFLDSAFPGTTSVERLGASTPMGAQVSSDQSSRTAREMQARDLSNKSDLAEKSNRASIITAAQTPEQRDSNLSSYAGSVGPGRFDSRTAQDREALDLNKPGLAGRSSQESAKGGFASDIASGYRVFKGLATSAGRNAGRLYNGSADLFRPRPYRRSDG